VTLEVKERAASPVLKPVVAFAVGHVNIQKPLSNQLGMTYRFSKYLDATTGACTKRKRCSQKVAEI